MTDIYLVEDLEHSSSSSVSVPVPSNIHRAHSESQAGKNKMIYYTYIAILNCTLPVITAKFPQSYGSPSPPKLNCQVPSPIKKTSAMNIHPSSSLQSPSTVLQYTCSLSCITGVITDHHHLKAIRENSVPAGLGQLVDTFPDVYGYDSNAKLSISYTYCTSQNAEEFCAYLWPRGMTRAEAGWLFDYIILTNHN